jgi:hypothetical protein
MSLVRWLRKNNKKLMAIVVIVLMVGFIGGSSLTYMLRSSKNYSDVVATIYDSRKVTQYDLALAAREMEILQILGAEKILQMPQISLLQTPDLHAVLLGELLFSERSGSPEVISSLSQIIGTNLYRISEKQINDLYNRKMPISYYWYCLSREAASAGIKVSNEGAGQILGQVMPAIFNGRSYQQYMASIVNSQGMPESEILAIFGKLLAVLQYSHLVCDQESITSLELKHLSKSQSESISVELVKLDSELFVKTQQEPDEGTMIGHFNKYKSFFAGQVSDQNPYGFGYMLPERVKLQYIILKLPDVSKIIKAPTQDEMESYYNQNKSALFSEEVRKDPNDANSPMITRVKPYSTVASIISKQLTQNKINSKAQSILQDARTLTEAGAADYNDTKLGKLSAGELKNISGDYQAVAVQLSKKYDIKVYSGNTGLLSAKDMVNDKNLSILSFSNPTGSIPVSLVDMAFAVNDLTESHLELYSLRNPRFYENIGPLQDISQQSTTGTGQIMALMRVTESLKASEPNELNTEYSIASIALDPNQPKVKVYSVKEQVSKDLKKLSALENTKTKADELLVLADVNNWDNTIEKYNELYGAKGQDANKPGMSDAEIAAAKNPLKLETLIWQRISSAMLDTLAEQYQGSPMARNYTTEIGLRRLLTEQLFSLVPSDSNSIELTKPVIMEFKPQMSYYCIKSLRTSPLWNENFEKGKQLQLYRAEINLSQSLSIVHLNPANILKRTNFKLTEQPDESTAETEEQS